MDEYGFRRSPDFDYNGYEQIMSHYFMVLTKRRQQWEKFMARKPNLHNNRSASLKRYIRKGIPGKRSFFFSNKTETIYNLDNNYDTASHRKHIFKISFNFVRVLCIRDVNCVNKKIKYYLPFLLCSFARSLAHFNYHLFIVCLSLKIHFFFFNVIYH